MCRWRLVSGEGGGRGRSWQGRRAKPKRPCYKAEDYEQDFRQKGYKEEDDKDELKEGEGKKEDHNEKVYKNLST